MNFNLIAFSISVFIFILIIILLYLLKNQYNLSLSSIDIKEKGFLYFIRYHLDSLFRNYGNKNWKIILLSWLLYIHLHLFFPFFLASFILKNDWNVIIAIVSLIVSMNIFQKIYPAELYSTKKEEKN